MKSYESTGESGELLDKAGKQEAHKSLSQSSKESYDHDEEEMRKDKVLPNELDRDADLMSGRKGSFNLVYCIYVAYGFSSLAGFNAILSTLDFLIESMPGYSPAFFVGWGTSLLTILAQALIMVYGHKLSFLVKNNVMIFFSMVLFVMMPLSCTVFDDAKSRFYSFMLIIIAFGLFNALQRGALFYQAS